MANSNKTTIKDRIGRASDVGLGLVVVGLMALAFYGTGRLIYSFHTAKEQSELRAQNNERFQWKRIRVLGKPLDEFAGKLLWDTAKEYARRHDTEPTNSLDYTKFPNPLISPVPTNPTNRELQGKPGVYQPTSPPSAAPREEGTNRGGYDFVSR